uniref:ORF43b n=1 Tax=Pinus koraiensis TaxID=88728 RepID=A4QMI2_PINKO|nr:ORF43b [Pinus koraiensis]ABP35323.1 ORF43b [Pinus koraiensis]
MNIKRNLFLKTLLMAVLIYCDNFLEWKKKILCHDEIKYPSLCC